MLEYSTRGQDFVSYQGQHQYKLKRSTLIYGHITLWLYCLLTFSFCFYLFTQKNEKSRPRVLFAGSVFSKVMKLLVTIGQIHSGLVNIIGTFYSDDDSFKILNVMEVKKRKIVVVSQNVFIAIRYLLKFELSSLIVKMVIQVGKYKLD